ncbi:MAG: S8 family serine peptidase, partial [Muribaculaceae bacterium]|nr:S8 family serine peptidase [Muribaculaceae bacterium]
LVPSYVSYGRKYRVNVTVRNLVSHVYSTVGGVKQSRYALGLSIYPRQNTTCEIDAWTGNSSSGYSFFPKPVKGADGVIRYPYFAAASDSCCIGTFAVGDSTLSAGAYAARDTYYSLPLDEMVVDNTVTLGQIAPFSSFQIAGAGPTGKALPDICAPGTNVVAAGSRYSYFAHGGKTTVMNVDGNYWGVMSGTSMAAPTVAGIIALWLQANPQLSVADVREIFANTAQHDMFTSQPQFGPNGKLDALAGMDYVLDHTAPMLGDVNGSGNIDILDAVAFINYLLNGQTAGFHLRAADLNHDGVIDISDLTALINILLGV